MGFFKKWFTKDFATKKDILTLEEAIYIVNNKINESALSEIFDRVEKLNKKVEKLEDRLLEEIKIKDDEISRINFRLKIREHLNKDKEEFNKKKIIKETAKIKPEDIKSMQLIDIDKINKILLPVPTEKLWKTTDAIIDILNNSKKDLHYKKIYTIIKSYNLSQADLSLQSLKSAMYNLKMSRKIEYGKETGTFRKKRSI